MTALFFFFFSCVTVARVTRDNGMAGYYVFTESENDPTTELAVMETEHNVTQSNSFLFAAQPLTALD